MASKTLRAMKGAYPSITVTHVFAVFPYKKAESANIPPPMLYPEGLETVPPWRAILHRNFWLADNAAFVIGYARLGSPAYQALEYARQTDGKCVVNLADVE